MQEDKDNTRNISLPSKKSVEEAIRVIENFRDLCKHELEVGYWATTDFPSKHHINKLLQFSYRSKDDLIKVYGEGFVRHIFQVIPICKAYLAFVKDAPNERVESKQK